MDIENIKLKINEIQQNQRARGKNTQSTRTLSQC